MTADDGLRFFERKFFFQSPRQVCDKSYGITKKKKTVITRQNA